MGEFKSTVSGIREQLIHGETSWIVENSEEGIYQGLKYLLQHPEICNEIRGNFGMESIYKNDIKYQKFIALCKKEKGYPIHESKA